MVISKHSHSGVEKGIYNMEFNKKSLTKINMTAMSQAEIKEKPEVTIYERKCLNSFMF